MFTASISKKGISCGNTKRNRWSTLLLQLQAGGVFFGTDRGKLVALNTKDGSLAWETDLGGTIAASPAIAKSKLIISNDRGTVFCFGKKD